MVRLLLLDGLLVTSCWEAKANASDDFDGSSLWPTWVPKTANGSIEAFDAATGKPTWSANFPTYMLMAADGVVYGLTNTGNPPTERAVVALDLKTGKEKWRVPNTALETQAGGLQLNTCGPGYVVVSQRGSGNSTPMGAKNVKVVVDKGIWILAAEDGKVLWKIPKADNTFTAVVDGLLWTDKAKYDPKTGEEKGVLPGIGGEFSMCTPGYLVGDLVLRNRGGNVRQLDFKVNPPVIKSIGFHQRGACIQGLVPANGLFYTAQNNCHCESGHVYGFLALGYSGPWPAKKEFPMVRPVEKGPAFGAVEAGTQDPADWPMYRHDSARSAATTAKAPETLKELWRFKAAAPAEGPVALAWKARLGSGITPPVVAGGLVFVAGADTGQIIALDAATGQKAWTALMGGRIDSAPTIERGLCVAGCHDGYVYAFSAKDGRLVWRTRVAPRERRMVAYAQMESVWPVIGTVVAHDGLLYADAGRSSETDGGISVLALDPASGEMKWDMQIASNGYGSMIDMLFVRDGGLGYYAKRMDLKTGTSLKVQGIPPQFKGFLDGIWTLVSRNRSGNAYRHERASGDLIAWNNDLTITPAYALPAEKLGPPTEPPPPSADAKPAEAPKKANSLPPAGFLWQPQDINPKTGYQVEAVVLAANAAVYAGRVRDTKKNTETYFLNLVSLADGKKIAESALECAIAYDGVVVAGEKVFVSLQNGTLLCLGK